MSETIGNLIDKLTIVNIRMWMFEDIKRNSADDKTIADATRRTNVLNQQRNDLIQEIDEMIVGVANGMKEMKLYGQGSSKLYGDRKDKQ